METKKKLASLYHLLPSSDPESRLSHTDASTDKVCSAARKPNFRPRCPGSIVSGGKSGRDGPKCLTAARPSYIQSYQQLMCERQPPRVLPLPSLAPSSFSSSDKEEVTSWNLIKSTRCASGKPRRQLIQLRARSSLGCRAASEGGEREKK